MKTNLHLRRGVLAVFAVMLSSLLAFGQNTECKGTSNVASEFSFTKGYTYQFETENETTVKVTFKLLDTDKSGVVALAFTRNPNFAETGMAGIGDNTFTASFANQTPGATFKVACKFAYAGGMVVTQYFDYTVGTVCEEVTDPVISVNRESLSVSPSGTVTVSAANLTSDITITSSSENFTVSPATLPASIISENITITYIGEGYDEQSATITLSSDGAEDVTIDVTGANPRPTITVYNNAIAIDPSGSFRVTGSNLLEDITVTCSSENFTVSPATIAASARYTTVNVTYNGAPGTSEESTVTLSSKDAYDVNVTVSGSAPDPTITVNIYSVTAVPNGTFTVSGVSLSSPITISCESANFTIDPTEIAADANNTTVNVTYTGAEGTWETSTVTLKSEGAEDVTISVRGSNFGDELVIDDFESDVYGSYKIESDDKGTCEVIDNPYAGGINESSKVMKAVRTAGSANWAGPILRPITAGDDRDATTGALTIAAGTFKYCHIMMYRESDGGTPQLKLSDQTPFEINPTAASSGLLTGIWQDVVFEIPATCRYDFLFLMLGRNEISEDLVCYIDNIVFNNDPEPRKAEDTEAPTDFTAEVAATNMGSVSFNLQATDNMGVINYTIECSNGQTYNFAGASGEVVNAVAGGLIPGTDYTFNISAADQQGNVSENSPIELQASTLEDTSDECEGMILQSAYEQNKPYKPEFTYSITSIPEGNGYKVKMTFTFTEPVNGFNTQFAYVAGPVQTATLVEGNTYELTWPATFEAGNVIQWYTYFVYADGVSQIPARNYTVGACMPPQPTITASAETVDIVGDGTGKLTVSSENLTKDIKVSIASDDFFVMTPENGIIEANTEDQEVEIMYIGADEEASTTLTLSSDGAADVIITVNYTEDSYVSVKDTEDDLKIWTADGGIYVQGVAEGETVAIFDVAGNTVYSEVSTGNNFANLQKGLYIVVAEGNSTKVILNR